MCCLGRGARLHIAAADTTRDGTQTRVSVTVAFLPKASEGYETQLPRNPSAIKTRRRTGLFETFAVATRRQVIVRTVPAGPDFEVPAVASRLRRRHRVGRSWSRALSGSVSLRCAG